jgi:hypothetical protein
MHIFFLKKTKSKIMIIDSRSKNIKKQWKKWSNQT